jgi:hypothetical protein
MERELLEHIIRAIHAGNSEGAVKLAQKALDEMPPPADTAQPASYDRDNLKISDAKKLVGDAIQFYMSAGKDVALAEFSNPQGRFRKSELYLYALSGTGTILAHPINEEYIGGDFLHLKDFDGKLFIQDILEIANLKGSGFVEYKWTNPISGAAESKLVYFEKTNDTIICGGIYMYK